MADTFQLAVADSIESPRSSWKTVKADNAPQHGPVFVPWAGTGGIEGVGDHVPSHDSDAAGSVAVLFIDKTFRAEGVP